MLLLFGEALGESAMRCLRACATFMDGALKRRGDAWGQALLYLLSVVLF